MADEASDRARDKGKARMPNDEEIEGDHNQDGSSNITLLRMANSASGVAQSLFGFSSSNGLLNDLVTSSTLGGKTGRTAGASVSQDAVGARSQTTPQHTDAPSSQRQQTSTNNIRSQSDIFARQTQQEFHEFDMQPPTLNPSFQYSSGLPDNKTEPLNWAAEFSNGSAVQSAPLHSYTPLPTNGHVHQAEMTDGADVLDLLADPTFSPGADLYEIPQIDDTVEQDASDLFGENFNAEEQQLAQTMRSNLPAPPTHGRINTAHPNSLNFASDGDAFDRLCETLDRVSLTDGDAHHSAFLTQLQRDWEAVSGSYTDEVWGDMLPDVKQAQEEIQAVTSGKRPLDSKAVARLKMILNHIEPRAAALQSSQPSLQQVRRPAPLDLQKSSSFNDVSDLTFETVSTITSSQVGETALNGGRSFYECPNQACLQTFPSNEAWAAHIAYAHRDLFNKSSPVLVEGYPTPWRDAGKNPANGIGNGLE